MPFTLFEPGADAPLGSLESIQALTNKLKANSSQLAPPKATTINLSTTAQPGLGVDAVVIAAQDGTAAGNSILRLLVAAVRVDKNGGGTETMPVDCVDTEIAGPLVVPTRQVPNNTGKILAMPRVIAEPGVAFGAAPLLATPILSVGYFKNAKDGADMNAVNIVPGTRVKLTGLSFEHAKPDKVTGVEPPPRARVKRVDVIAKPNNATSAAKILKNALENQNIELYTAIAVVGSLGGIEKIGETAPLLASDLAIAQRDLRQQAADGLRFLAARLEGVVAGEGEAYAAPVCRQESRTALLAMADSLQAAPITAPLSMLLGSPVELPLIFPGHTPNVLAPIMETPTTLSEAPIYTRARISSISVEVQDGKGTGVLTIYPTFALSLSGNRALIANGAGQPAFYNINPDAFPTCAIKYSLKNFAPVLGTSSLKKTALASKELIPYAPMTISTELYPRSGDDAIFSDKSGGSNWANIFDFDLRGALMNASLPVSVEFVQTEYCAGENTISEYEPADNDKIAPPGSSTVKPPTLDSTGVFSASEKTRKISKLVDEYPGLAFYVVAEGVTEAVKNDPELLKERSKAEAWVKSKFGGSTPEETEKSLISNTLLFAVKPLLNNTPETSDAGEEEEDGEEDDDDDEDWDGKTAQPLKKRAKKRA